MKQPVVPILSVGSLAFYSAATNPTSSALSLQDVNSSRRDLFRKIPAAFTGAVTIGVVTHSHGCLCSSCNGASDSSDSFVAFAYERRDVGGDSPSPEMAAMNLQAYQTMNRLERDGVKLEVSNQTVVEIIMFSPII